MDNLYHQTVRLLTDTQQKIQELSVLRDTRDLQVMETRVWENMQQLEQDCYRLENMARKEPPTRRQEAKHRVDQLLADYRVVKNAYQSHQQLQMAAEQELRMREELMSRQFTPNSADASIVMMDQSLQHNERLRTANQGLDRLIEGMSDMFGNLKNQHFTLKNAQRKVLDIASTLGLSNTVMRLIEKRSEQDKWIFLAGVFITVVIIILAFKYLL